MTTRMPSVGAILTILVFTLSVFAATLFVWKSFGGSTPLQAKGYRVHVQFGSGGTQLFSNADVRIAGVRVGKVRTVRPDGRRTDAELELEPRFAPLATDAHAILRTKTLLGRRSWR
ncbi:MCE family protein [Conexibacter sp. W3-3-2]|uniref:MlaD family protein n=1 Tax=Conexibacter sp. W3-3-2 TaxID=2675227 RepID=UPI0012B8D5DA|nr:MlaD family protein [Conexibacter sp. W3-3-2]MTD47760.1 MCE family protein [Conexibacter sp. W3-3-2]